MGDQRFSETMAGCEVILGNKITFTQNYLVYCVKVQIHLDKEITYLNILFYENMDAMSCNKRNCLDGVNCVTCTMKQTISFIQIYVYVVL